MRMAQKRTKKDEYNEEAISRARRLMEEKGRKTLELTRKLMLENEDRIQCTEVLGALRYFANEYWSDLARPTLMSLACEAVGGDCQAVTSIVVPIMLFTAGMDIHDDLIDQSKTKNGRLTVFGKFGKDIALLTGDALLFKGFVRLHDAFDQVGTQKAAEVLRIIEDLFFELGDAEALELRLKAKVDADPEEYLWIVRKKAADVEAYTYISALIGDGKTEEIEALRKYGRILGMLAIIRDDLIDTLDEEELMHRLKKEVAPLPLLYAARNPEARAAINSIILEKRATRKDIVKIIQTISENKGVTETEKKIKELVEEGLSSVNRVKHKREELQTLIDVMNSR